MNKELELFLESKAKKNSYGGYNFVLETIHFKVIELPLGISLQYDYIAKRELIEPQVIILDKNISLQEFSTKVVEIVESIKKV